MKRIRNSTQLNAEIARLKGNISEQEIGLKNDLVEIKESLKPANLLVSTLSSMTGVKISGNEFLKDGFAYGLSLLFQRFVFKSERKMEHKVYEFVDTIIEKIKQLMEKFTSSEAKRSERMADDTTSDKI